MSDPQLTQYIDSVRWKFAKTMPTWPHWYTLLSFQDTPEKRYMFFELAKRIFELGYDKRAKNGKIFRYYDVGEFLYWSCDPTIESTDLINRAYIDGRIVNASDMKDIMPRVQNDIPIW